MSTVAEYVADPTALSNSGMERQSRSRVRSRLCAVCPLGRIHLRRDATRQSQRAPAIAKIDGETPAAAHRNGLLVSSRVAEQKMPVLNQRFVGAGRCHMDRSGLMPEQKCGRGVGWQDTGMDTTPLPSCHCATRSEVPFHKSR